MQSVQRFDDLQCDQILAVSVADYQQSRGGLADTIRQWSGFAPSGGMAKW
ncbi:hypothetical protein [Synechococcus sp. UW179A]|nr:hypothetical protein [Synechococcus sp. UW179A]